MTNFIRNSDSNQGETLIRKAKHSSAANHDGSGLLGSVFGRRAFAIRGGSGDAQGTSAISGLLLVVLGALALCLLFAASAASAAPYEAGTPASLCSGTGAGAGECGAVKGVAVDQSNGNVYAVDSGNFRVDEFASSGTFVRAFGADVVSSGPDQANEVQTVTVNATGGSFTLTFGSGGAGVSTTGELSATATPAEVQGALNALSNISTGGGSVAVSGGPGDAGGTSPYKITFNGGPLAGTNVAQTTATNVSLAGGNPSSSVATATFNEGAIGFEICTTADTCKAGSTSASIPGAFGSPARAVAVDSVTHVVFVTTAAARVASFNGTTGAFISQTEGNTTTSPNVNAGAPEKFANLAGVAVDVSNPAQHYLYVPTLGTPTTGRTLIDKFAISASGVTAGSYLCQITGTATDTSLNHTECGTPGPAHKDGAFEGVVMGTSSVGAGQAGGNLAVDASGNLFIAEGPASSGPANRHIISEFSNGGNYVTQFRPGGGTPPLSGTEPRPEAVAVLPSGNLLVVDGGISGGAGGTRVQEYDPSTISAAVPPAITSASPLTEFGSGTIGTSVGVTSYGSDVFIADLTNKKILKYSPVEPATVTTEPATALTKTTATLNGSVNPNRLNVSNCHFEYGLTESYGQTVPCAQNPGSGAKPIAVSAAISGLTLETTYHFRLVATNSIATTNGSDRTFTTASLNKPTATTIAGATELTQTAAKVAGTVNPNGLEITDCHIAYGLTNAYGATAPCVPANPGSGISPVNVTASLSGLTTHTLYHFKVVATNSDGTGEGADQTFETLPNPPAVTTTAGATAIAQTTATVAATVNPNSGNVTECKVEYGLTNAYGSAVGCTSLPGAGSSPVAVSASPTGLTANTTYHFRFKATNVGGTGTGGDQTFQTLPNRPTLSSFSAEPLSQTLLKVKGFVNPNSGNVTECKFEYGISNAYGSSVPCIPASPGSGATPVEATATLTGLVANTTYHFRLAATNAGGTTNGPDQVGQTLPSAPTVITAAGANGIAQTLLKVKGFVNPNSGNVTECKVEYGLTNAYGSEAGCASLPGSGSSLVTVTTTLNGLTPNTTYHVRFKATNVGGTGMGGDQTFTTKPFTHTLTVGKTGTGAGAVTCNGGPCISTYNDGTIVTLSAVPGSNSTFAAWSGGGCSGTGVCTITIEADTTVTARFMANSTPSPEEKVGTLKVAAIAPVSGGKASLAISCNGGGACKGDFKLIAKIKGKRVVIGAASYDLAAGKSETIEVDLSAVAMKELNRGHMLKVKLSGQGFRGTVQLRPPGAPKHKRSRHRPANASQKGRAF